VDLDQLFTLLDRTVHPVETGTVPKADAATALEAYLKVGQPGGKTRERFDALMQALEADQEGPVVIYKKLFEEDREFNQGEPLLQSSKVSLWVFMFRGGGGMVLQLRL
jgi:hypothetical protein